jgi:hypothetical protein
VERRDPVVRRILRHLVEDCDSPLDLREIVDKEYPRLLESLQYVLAYDVHDHERSKQLPEIPTREFTEAERKILESHDPLLISLAKRYSRGHKSFNHARSPILWIPASKRWCGAFRSLTHPEV